MTYDLPGPLKNLLPGNIDSLRGPYATVSAANAAIPNNVVGGISYRQGKFVEIGTAGSYVTYWWKGGYGDLNLIEYSPAGINSDDAKFLKSHTSLVPGEVMTVGVPNPTVGLSASDRAYFFDAPIKATGVMSEIVVPVVNASTLYIKKFSLSSDGLTYAYGGEFNVPVNAGLNTISIDNHFIFNFGDIIALYTPGLLTYTNETGWSAYRSVSGAKNITTGITLSLLGYTTNINIQVRFKFISGTVSRAEFQSQETAELVADKIVNGVNFNPKNPADYTSYPMGIIDSTTGFISDVSKSNPLRRFSGFNDISGVSSVYFENFNEIYEFCFYDASQSPILPVRKVKNNIDIPKPTNAKYFAVNIYAGSNPLDFKNIFYGYRIKNSAASRQDFDILVAEVNNIRSLENIVSKKYDLSWRSFFGKQVVDINSSFREGSQQARLQMALDFAEGKNLTLVLGRDTINNTSIWTINSAALIGSWTALVIDTGITLKLGAAVVDNIIRNKGVGIDTSLPVHSTAYMNPPEANRVKQDEGIIVIGMGEDKSFFEGSDSNFNAPRPSASGGGTSVPWIGDNYGYRPISIYLANVKGVEVGGYTLSKTKSWGTVLELCENFYMHDIYTDSSASNGDGCDVVYSKRGLVKNIHGITLDDLLFIGGIPRTVNITYPDYSRYIYPTSALLNYLKTLPLSAQDTMDIDVQNVTGSSKTITLRVLATMGLKATNIDINNVTSIGGNRYTPYSILSIETGYNINGGSVAQPGDMDKINANNVTGVSTTDKTIVKAPLRNSWLNDIERKDSTVGVVFLTYPQDATVKVTNLR